MSKNYVLSEKYCIKIDSTFWTYGSFILSHTLCQIKRAFKTEIMKHFIMEIWLVWCMLSFGHDVWDVQYLKIYLK